MKHLQNEIAAINSGESSYMKDRAQKNALKVENFQHEMNEEAREIQIRIEQLRSRIEERRGNHENLNGFLLG